MTASNATQRPNQSAPQADTALTDALISDTIGASQSRAGRRDMGETPTPDRPPLGCDQTGLRGKLAHILVDEPTDEIDWPADLPPGTTTVVIVDDTPNPHHTLRVHPVDDPDRVALVVYDQLGLM